MMEPMEVIYLMIHNLDIGFFQISIDIIQNLHIIYTIIQIQKSYFLKINFIILQIHLIIFCISIIRLNKYKKIIHFFQIDIVFYLSFTRYTNQIYI
jgi:hypothetical protein